MLMKIKDFITKYGDGFVHSNYFIALVAIFAFSGWWADIVGLSYYGMAVLMIVALICTKDLLVFLIFLPFGMTCFRHFFFFDSIPPEILAVGIALVVSLIGMIIKNIIYNKQNNIKTKWSFGLIGKGMAILTIILFISTIVRHIFFNEPVFPEYASAYNISLGYLSSLGMLGLTLLIVAFSTFAEKNHFKMIANIIYIYAIFLVGQHLVACITAYGFDFSKYKNVYPDGHIGWCDKNTMAIAIEVTLPFMAYLYSKNFKRVDVLMVMGFLGIFILMGDSRGGQVTVISVALLLVFIIFENTKNKWRNFSIAAVLSVAIGTLMIFVIPEIYESIKRLIDLGFDMSSRDLFWGWIIDYVIKQPEHLMLGGSPVFLFEMFPVYVETNDLGIWLCHNTFMTVLAAGGLLGLLAIIFHFVEATGSIIKRCGDERTTLIALLLMGFIHGMIDNTFFNPVFTLPYLIILSTYNKEIKELF